MNFVIYTANCTGNKTNCDYPNKVEIDSAESLMAAVKKDHVCESYKDNYRSNDNFISSDVIVMDVDNDHTDDPAQFITFEKMDELFPDVSYVLVPSRNHMKAKGSHTLAPRFHVMFPVERIDDANEYAAVKEKLAGLYPFFNNNALDAARFFFGSDVKEVIWHEGWISITEEIEDAVFTESEEANEEFDAPAHSGPILEGSRNKTLSHNAIGDFIKHRIGNNMKILFHRIVKVIKECDDVDMTTAFIDGTKFEANANKYTFVWKRAVIKYLKKMQNKITESITRLNDYTLLRYMKEFEIKEAYQPEDILEIMDWLMNIAKEEKIEFKEESDRKKHPIQRFYNEFIEYEKRMLDYMEKIEICDERNSYSKTDTSATFMLFKRIIMGERICFMQRIMYRL